MRVWSCGWPSGKSNRSHSAAAQPQHSSGVRKVLGFVCLGVIGLFILLGIFGGIVGDSGGGGSGGSATEEPAGRQVQISEVQYELLGFYDGEFHQMEITGVLKNLHSVSRKNLYIRFGVSDFNGNKTDEAWASIASLDPNGTWKFTARTSEVGICSLEGVWAGGRQLEVNHPEIKLKGSR